MHKRSLILAGVLFLPVLAAAAGKSGFETVSYRAAQQEVEALTQTDTSAAVYIWANKMVYQAGEPLTLRWTSKTNNDLYPYTLFAYRINNQTGVKAYLPGNTAEVTDIFGNNAAAGFRITRLPEASKQVLVGAGGILSTSPATIPNEPGMHTLVLEIRDYTATRVVKSAYFKISVVTEFVNVSGNIESSTTWVNTKAYRMTGIVFVRNNAVLTIEPGTVILGQPSAPPNPSTLVVSRTGRIVANGTRQRPIIMTSPRDVGQRERGDWGGLILLGSARINSSAEAPIEGLPDTTDSRYGGTNDNHNCGTLRYVRVEFAGAVLAPANEVNGITWGACGKETITEHVQAHYGFDDNFEWFGGTNDGKYMVSTYARDDYFDWQLGWTGRLQYGVAVANGDFGNRGIEADNLSNPQDAQPLSKPTLYNLSFIGNPESVEEDVNANAGIWLRRGTGGALRNIVVYHWNQTGIEIRDTGTVTAIGANDLTADGLLLWDNGRDRTGGAVNTLQGQVGSPNTPEAVLTPLREWLSGSRGQAARIFVEDPKMRRPLEYSDPDFRPGLGSPLWKTGWVQPPDDGFFDQSARFLGAFGDVDWSEEWVNFLVETDLR